MLETLETLNSTILQVKSTPTSHYTLHAHWKAEESDPQGAYEYYEENDLLSPEVVEAIYNQCIDDLETDEIFLSTEHFTEIVRSSRPKPSSSPDRILFKITAEQAATAAAREFTGSELDRIEDNLEQLLAVSPGSRMCDCLEEAILTALAQQEVERAQ